MSGRMIDAILLALLGIILLAMLVLALGVGRPRPAGANVTAAPPPTPVAPSPNAVQPLTPGTGPTSPPPEITPVAPGTSPPPGLALPGAPDQAAPPRPALPSGEVALSRVSFAYANGVGACNIPLLPWQHIAVSPDLLATYGCGATVRVTLAEPVAGRSTITAVVADRMGPAMERAINIFVAPTEPALQYGVTEGSLAAP